MSNINCFLKSTLINTSKGDLSFKELYDLQETGKPLPKVLTSFTHDNFEFIEILEVLKEVIKPGDVVLLKASNGMKFYELAERMISLWKKKD